MEQLSGFLSFRDLSDVRENTESLHIFEVAASTLLARYNILHGNSTAVTGSQNYSRTAKIQNLLFYKMLIFPKCETCNHFISV